MALIIVSAKDREDAHYKVIKLKNKEAYTEEPKRFQDFIFDYKNEFEFYENYLELNLYGISKIDNGEIKFIKEFLESITRFLEENAKLENKIIEKYNLSMKKIRNYIGKLMKILDFAEKNGDDIVGLGD
ncbi:hypothetical protein [Peptoniphilus sp. BV3AC2]|uniref:hypothetical protein n=1 Tax=Peptoniphilus sp. BV3AC2 TaxID=1111133 RepID=UPI0003B86A6E|nr:hypothetical protein [Peptoniphilus sp. BV3AC2]ERT64769.1 hypothetical protein HMPREF1252_1655 [Peptoniphilus sp. BV3AC2]